MFAITKSHKNIRNKWLHTNIAILWTIYIGLIYNYIDKLLNTFESIRNVLGRNLVEKFTINLAITHTYQNFLLG